MPSGYGRIDALDALRGFALLGILVVNIQVFSGWGFLGPEGREPLSRSEYDHSLLFWLKVFAHDKFYSLFSLLFGYSFVLVAASKGAFFHLKRMFGLALIGLAHALLLWPWDILLMYAVIGVMLTPFLRCGPKTLLSAAGILLMVVGAGRFLLMDAANTITWHQDWLSALAEQVPVFAAGAYGEVRQANQALLPANILDRLADLRPARVMVLFLLGAAAARWGLAQPEPKKARALVLIAIVAWPIGLACAIGEQWLVEQGDTTSALFIVNETLAGPAMAMAYGSLLMWLWNNTGILGRLLRTPFAPIGRMALTNYLAQSAIGVCLFYGFGGDYFAEYSLANLMVFSAILFIAQVLFSALWLALFRQGPLEWLWRWQTQGKRSPLLKTTA